MWATFNRFELQMTKSEAASASHPGPCDSDAQILLSNPKIKKQLDKIAPELIAAELHEYGAWDESELKNAEQNRARIVWVAANDITEGIYLKSKK